MAYDDGEVRQEFSVCFHARVLGSLPPPSPTSTVHSSMRRRIDAALAERDAPQVV